MDTRRHIFDFGEQALSVKVDVAHWWTRLDAAGPDRKWLALPYRPGFAMTIAVEWLETVAGNT
ncbi:hypothetical protein [Nocardia rosealba]|uniref:hypothetical protein n=1 Tax=Nocardia rosealba TaxID=2878563 RepID=UPI001CD97319|nr:hypothetical protein [Nocardia rosealba]MCA2207847.1 hypothetical protein [Nocardia rosealba]